MIRAGWILYALVALVPVFFYRGTSEVFEFPKTELLAAGTLLLLAANGFTGRLRERLESDPLGVAIGLFLLSAFVSALFAIRHDAAFFGAHESEAGLKTALATAGIYFASRSLASDARHLERLVWAATFALLCALVYALLQIAGLDPLPWTRSATIGVVRRVPGTLGHANHLGTFIAMMLPLTAWLRTTAKTRGARVYAMVLGILSIPVLAATLSRGAWVAAAAGLLAFGILSWRGGRSWLLPAAVVIVAAFLVPLLTPLRPELLLRLRQITDVSAPSTQSRIHLWRAGIAMAAEHPILGVGTDGYLAAFPRYRTPEYWKIEWNGVSAKAHDEPIQIAATQGVLGLALALLVVFFTVRAQLRRGHEAAAVGGALTAFAVSSLAGFTVVSTGVLAAALAGWLGAAGDSGNARPAPGRVSSTLARILALLLGVVFVILPWLAEITVGSPAQQERMSSYELADRFARASALAPWDARYPTERGRVLLGVHFADPDPGQRAAATAAARGALERAARLAPRDGEVQALLARTMASQGASVDSVRSGFDRATALEPTNANVLELVTQGWLEMGRIPEARAAALRCATLYPDFALPMADLGVMALMEGRPRAAADTLTLALKRNWHGEEGAAMAAKSNYVAALREMRLSDVLPGSSAPTPTRPSPTR